MVPSKEHNRAVTPAVATILLVAVVVVLGATVTTYFFGFTEKIGGPTAEATFSYDESPVGIEMTADQIGEDVSVELNGQRVASFDSSDAGQSRLIPTSPGDQLTVVSADGSRSVLVSRTVDDRDEIGDFIAHYTFDDADSDDVLEDQSGNNNDGDIMGDPDWTGESISFDGSNDYITVSDISAPVDVEEFTIAVAYKQRSDADVNQLVEHQYGADNEWFLETRFDDPNTYRMEFAVEFPDNEIYSSYAYDTGGRRVAVGTYDGTNYNLYMNGNQVAGDSFTREVSMGDMRIARDFESSNQFLNGEIYEIRLYYSAFDDKGVDSITKAMS